MSTSNEIRSVAEVFAYTLEAVTLALYAENKQTTMKEVAASVITELSKVGVYLHDSPHPPTETTTAIEQAREYLRKSKTEHARTGAQSAAAVCLQGILTIMIAQQEHSEANEFAGISLPEEQSTPMQGLWGGGGAKG